MKREIPVALSALIIVFLAVAAFALYKSLPMQVEQQVNAPASPYDGVYVVGGKPIPIISAVHHHSAGDSVALTRVFGNEKRADINSDGILDSIFLLVQERNDNKSEYFVTGIVSSATGTQTVPAIPLGLSIAPQTIGIEEHGVIAVNYAVTGESLRETIGETLRLKYDARENMFGLVAPHFEGEASAESMSLQMKTWEWKSAVVGGETRIPQKPGVFALTFVSDQTFSLRTDCNGGGGEYTVERQKITFSNMISTLMYCEGSQEQAFRDMLARVSSFSFSSKGELVLHTSQQEDMIFQ